MKFEIGFNRHNDINNKDSILEELGAKLINREECSYYEIDLPNFEDLEVLINKLDKITDSMYSAVISFDSAVIFLDDKV